MYSHPMGYINHGIWIMGGFSKQRHPNWWPWWVAHIRHPFMMVSFWESSQIFHLFQVGELVNYFDLPSLFWRKRILWQVPKHFLGGLHERGDPWVRLQDFQPVTGVHSDQLHFGVTRHWRNGSACKTGTRFVHWIRKFGCERTIPPFTVFCFVGFNMLQPSFVVR